MQDNYGHEAVATSESNKGAGGGAAGGGALPRTVGYFSGTMMCVGMVIGSGIFSIPANLFGVVGSPGMVLALFLGGALVALFGTAAYVEWGCMRPVSGGDKEYLAYAFPKSRHLFSFVFSQTMVFLVRPGQCAAVSIAFGEYMMFAIRGARSAGGDDAAYETFVRALAVGCAVFVIAVHYLSPRVGIIVQDLLTTTKMGLLSLVILIGLGALIWGDNFVPRTGNFDAPFDGTTTSANAYATGFFMIFFAFDGWNNLNYSLDELIDPIKNLPRCAFSALAITSFLYIFAATSYFIVVPTGQFDPASSTLAAQFFTIAVGDTVGGRIVPVFIALSALGSAMCGTYGSSRVAFAAAQEGFIPFANFIGRKSAFHSPGGALLLHGALMLTFILAPPPGAAYNFLISASVYPEWIFYGLTVFGLLYLRITEPNTVRPVRSFWITNILFIFVAIFLTVFPFVPPETPPASGIPYYLYALVGLLWVALCVPWWYVQIIVNKGMEKSIKAREMKQTHFALDEDELNGRRPEFVNHKSRPGLLGQSFGRFSDEVEELVTVGL